MEKSKAEKSKKIITQYKRVFSTDDGRAVLFDLMKSNFMIDSTPFVPGQPDVTNRNLGKQELVKQILFFLKVDPEKFLSIVNEQEESHV